MLISSQSYCWNPSPSQSCHFAGRRGSAESQKSQIAFAPSVKLNTRGCKESRGAHINVLHWNGERSGFMDGQSICFSDTGSSSGSWYLAINGCNRALAADALFSGSRQSRFSSRSMTSLISLLVAVV